MWKKLQINKQNIITETAKAVLIACPKNSDAKGFSFWHPAKLVRDGNHKGAISISYTDEFEFNLKRYGKHNNVLSEQKVSAEELEEIFGTMHENIRPRKEKDNFETHKPKTVEAEAVEVLDELKDE